MYYRVFCPVIQQLQMSRSVTSSRTWVVPLSFPSWSEVAQSCPTLWDPMDCSLPGSSVHGIFQAIVLEWLAIFFSRGSSQPRDRTRVSCIVDRRFTIWATKEGLLILLLRECERKWWRVLNLSSALLVPYSGFHSFLSMKRPLCHPLTKM